MTQYIIGAVSELDTPLQPSTKALRSFSAYMANVTVEDIHATGAVTLLLKDAMQNSKLKTYEGHKTKSPKKK